MGKLTAMAVKAAKVPGRYGDGDGLYLQVAPNGSASWVVRVQSKGRRRDIGLGSARKVSLATARQEASKVRSQVAAGIDPVAERIKAAGIPTFREAAAQFHAEQKKAWRNVKHREQWLSTLNAYAFPAIGDLPVNLIEAPQVRDVLAEIWLTKNETARRVRQRVSAVIDWAVGKGFREASLPMPVINRALPKVTAERGHHAAMAYNDVPAFMPRLRERESWGRLALEAAILTAARSAEIRGATWDEIDLEAGLWTVPGERMKGGKKHVVPLSPAAKRVFQRARELSSGAVLCFEGMKHGKPMSDMTMTKALRDMGLKVTQHGFRATFRTWVEDCLAYSNDAAEKSLAHVIKDATQKAYRRGDMLDKRRVLMNAWADYCDSRTDNVVHIAAA